MKTSPQNWLEKVPSFIKTDYSIRKWSFCKNKSLQSSSIGDGGYSEFRRGGGREGGGGGRSWGWWEKGRSFGTVTSRSDQRHSPRTCSFNMLPPDDSTSISEVQQKYFRSLRESRVWHTATLAVWRGLRLGTALRSGCTYVWYEATEDVLLWVYCRFLRVGWYGHCPSQSLWTKWLLNYFLWQMECVIFALLS